MTFAVKPILPRNKRIINPELLDRGVASALKKAASAAAGDFKATTMSWTNRPTFMRSGVKRDGMELRSRVFTWDLIYRYVALGTKPHPIRPRRGGFLVFRWQGYGHDVAKTAPRWIGSRPAGPAGPVWRVKEVWHPGTVAREYPQVIAALRQPPLVADIQRTIRESIWR